MRLRRLGGIYFASLLGALSTGQLHAQGDDLRLVTAMKNQDVAAVRSFLAEGVGVDTPDLESATPLHWATHWNDTTAVRLLLDAGAQPNARNRFDVTPLHEAALQLNPELIQALLNAGADPNAAFGDGETALMTAARAGSAQVVGLLIEHGGNVHARESWHGQTALMWAAQENHADVAQLLIDNGAQVDSTSTAHDWINIVYSAGNVPKSRDVGGLTPLHFAARHGSIDAAKVLLAAGADSTAAEPMYELTPLQTAIVNGHFSLAREFVRAGADVNDGSLYLAVDTRNLGYYAQRPNPPAKDGDITNFDIVSLLLEHGADPDSTYTKGIPERTVAGQITAPPGATPLDRAAVALDIDVIRALIQHGADANAAADDGATALLLLAGLSRGRPLRELDESAQRLEALRMLLAAGANPNAVHPGSDRTAVQFAADFNADQIVSLLAEFGADTDIGDITSQTAAAAAGVPSSANPAR